MKKIVVMLLVVSLLCVGCGKTSEPVQESKPVAEETESVTTEAAIEESTDEVKVEDNKPVEKPITVDEPVVNKTDNAKVHPSDTSSEETVAEVVDDGFPLKHVNAEVDPQGWYFDDMTQRENCIKALFDPYTFDKYTSYTTQWLFDDLEMKTDYNDEKTKVNLEKIAKEVKDAYFKSEGRNPEYKDVIYNEYDDGIVPYWGIYVAGPETEKDGMYSQNGDYIVIIHCMEDAPNGVTVHLIKDCSNRDLISAYLI